MKNIITATLLVLASNAFSQLNYFRYDSIEVVQNGDTLIDNVWSGAFNNAQWSHIDLNGDTLQDLVLFDRDGFTLKTFINRGTPNEVDYYFAPEFIPIFPKFDYWVLLRDYNCDGHQDIFAHTNLGAQVWRNTYLDNNELGFELITPTLKSDSFNIKVLSSDIPAIDDIDGDGDLDILTFDQGGTLIEFHENWSMDSLGTCDSLYFHLADACWGKFEENSQDNSLTYPINCKGNVSSESSTHLQHAGSSLLTLDVDEDGDKDIVLGDLLFNNLVIAINGGDNNFAQITSHDTVFPQNFTNTLAADLTVFPAAYYLDVDNDTIKDLLVSPNADNVTENFASTWYYKNNGQNNNPDFELIQQNFLQDEMIELGSGNNPVFFDANADGLLDIITGNYGYYDQTSIYISGLAYYENIGNPQNPKYKLITNDYASTMALNSKGVYPTFGDLDGDGDEDMIAGDFDGYVHYYENTAGTGNPASFGTPIQQYAAIDIGQFSTPQLVDVDKDGVLDLLIGERGGTLNFFKNSGTVNNPSFTSVPTNSNFGGIDVMDLCCTGYSSPFLTALDSTNTYYLFVGSEQGIIYFYENIDGNLAGSFTLSDSLDTYSHRVSVTLKDINNDKKLELIYGEYGGGMTILTTDSEGAPKNIRENRVTNFDLKAYPNPTQNKITIGNIPKVLIGETATIYSLSGKKTSEVKLTGTTTVMDLAGFAAGAYVFKINTNGYSLEKEIIKKR